MVLVQMAWDGCASTAPCPKEIEAEIFGNVTASETVRPTWRQRRTTPPAWTVPSVLPMMQLMTTVKGVVSTGATGTRRARRWTSEGTGVVASRCMLHVSCGHVMTWTLGGKLRSAATPAANWTLASRILWTAASSRPPWVHSTRSSHPPLWRASSSGPTPTSQTRAMIPHPWRSSPDTSPSSWPRA